MPIHRSSRSPRVLLISLDGLMPSSYRNNPNAPTLEQIRAAGAAASSASTVYPSLTYTAHASIATSTYPSRHGILTNSRFDPECVTSWRAGEPHEWYFEESHFRVDPIWRVAERHGVPTALIRWPTTVGAQTTWLLAEYFEIGSTRSSWGLMKGESTPQLIAHMEGRDSFSEPMTHEELDEVSLELTLQALREPRLRLIMAHFTQFDHAVHEHARDTPDTEQALRRIDDITARILTEVDLSNTHVFIFGDHGFVDFSRRIHINALFHKNGWIQLHSDLLRIANWQAIAHTNCGQAAIYLRDRDLADSVMDCLDRNQADAYRVLKRESLDALYALPDAFCAIEAQRGFSLGQNLSGELITNLASPQGEHGYLPTRPEMNAGLLILGPNVAPGTELGHVSLLDIAPTVAKLLTIPFQADGAPIPLPTTPSPSTRVASL